MERKNGWEVWLAIAIAMGLVSSGLAIGRATSTVTSSITVDDARVRDLRAVSPTRIRTLANRVSQLPATQAVSAPENAAPHAPSETQPVELDPEQAREAPRRNEIQRVPTSRQLDQEIANALAARPAINQFISAGGELQVMPDVLRQINESGEVVQLKAYALIARPLAYNPASGMFTGEIGLGVTDIVPGRPRRELSTPIHFEVIGAHEADPVLVRVAATTPPHPRVRVTMTAAGAIRVASDLIPQGVGLDMPLAPALSMLSGSTSIEGWGLGKTDINISLTGLSEVQNRFVNLRATSGFLEKTRVPLDENGNATVSIRSDQLGTAVITATTPGYQRAETQIAFRFPYTTLMASLLGGLVGAGIRVFARAGLTGKRVVFALLGGVLVGTLIFALYAVGVNVLPVTPTVTVGAVLVFAISGLGAFLGSRQLESA